MPSKRPPAGPSDPHLALAKALLQLKLRTASLKADGSDKALRECIKAAGDVEGCLGVLEAGPSLLQLALSQANAPAAAKVKDQARQLSSDAASLLESLSRCADVSEETSWQLLRPVLRLLLWLVPEHVPLYSGCAAIEPLQAAGGSAPSHKQGQQTKPGAGSGKDWRRAVAKEYILDVATMPLAEAMLAALEWSTDLDSPAYSVTPLGLLGFWMVEEGLAWLTVFARFRYLALELQADMGQPAQPPNPGKPKRGAPQDTSLAGLLIPKLAGRMQLLLMRSEAVCFWLRGSIQLGTHSTWWKSDRANEEREFAARFIPFKQMANATGLWGGVPVIGQRVIGLLCGLLPHRFWDTLDSPNYHANAVLAHSELLTGLLASDYGLVSAPQVAEHNEHLDVKFKMHLQGLVLALRAAVGSGSVKVVTSAWNAAGIALRYGACHVLRLELAIPLKGAGDAGCLQSYMYLPRQAGDARQAESSSPSYLWSLMARCDSCSLFEKDDSSLPAADPLYDWTSTAATFVEALRLLSQITSKFIELQHGKRREDQVTMKDLVYAALVVMPWLRPATPGMLSANAAASTAWASCMVTVLELSELLSTWDPRAYEGPDHARALDILLGHLLPVLRDVSVARSQQWEYKGAGEAHQESDQSASHSGQPGSLVTPPGGTAGRVAGTGPSSSSAACPAGQASGSSSAGDGELVTAPCLPSPDSTLMLLSAASQLLSRIALAEEAAAAANMEASRTSDSSPQRNAAGGELQNIGECGGDTGRAFAACLSLAHRLVADRSLWQVAKARYPLLLIEALNKTTTGLASVVTVAARWRRASWAGESEGSQNQEVRQATWSAAADWEQPGATFQEHLDRQVASPEHSSSALGPAATAGVQEQGSSSAGASDQPSMPSTALRCTTLLVELALQLWSLLGDASIVGDQESPASWMVSIDSTARKLCDSLSGVLSEIDACVSTFIRFQFDNNTAQQRLPERKDVVRVALQLASLAPAVPLSRFRAATGCDTLAFLMFKTYRKLAALPILMCAHPLLRVVCMLALMGLLTEHQRQGVVALLGGVCSSSCPGGDVAESSSMAVGAQQQSSLLIPEPASLSAIRQQHNLSLSQLAVFMLWTQRSQLPDPPQQIKLITRHLLLAYGAQRLPSIARIQDYLMVQDLDDRNPLEYLGVPMASIDCWQQPSFKDTYLGWMQATLLKIIQEVLSQHGP